MTGHRTQSLTACTPRKDKDFEAASISSDRMHLSGSYPASPGRGEQPPHAVAVGAVVTTAWMASTRMGTVASFSPATLMRPVSSM